MSKFKKLLEKVLKGTSDRNIYFDDLRNLLLRLKFNERIKGNHYIFSNDEIREIINLQPLKSGKAKAYQVRQVRDLILTYRLGDTDV
ncbi:MAG: hypothetical protein V3U37_02115 [Nitrospinaceae bacterium]